MFSDPPLTKRQLGWLFVLGGLALAIGTLAVDWLGAGHYNGLGPAQRQALLGSGALILFGLTLLPLGKRLA